VICIIFFDSISKFTTFVEFHFAKIKMALPNIFSFGKLYILYKLLKKTVMKNICFYFFTLLFATLTSCSNDSIDQFTAESEIDLTEYEPYISPELQAIFDMADTCTTGIPLEAIFPNLDILTGDFSTDSNLMSTRAVGDYVQAVGASSYYINEYKIPLNISEEQFFNLNFSSSTGLPATGYYGTVYIVTLNVINPGGTLINAYTSADIMGVHPDNSKTIGFSTQEVSPNVFYKLTTYLWAIHSVENNVVQNEVLYVVPCHRKVPSQYDNNPVYIINNYLTWSYVVG